MICKKVYRNRVESRNIRQPKNQTDKRQWPQRVRYDVQVNDKRSFLAYMMDVLIQW